MHGGVLPWGANKGIGIRDQVSVPKHRAERLVADPFSMAGTRARTDRNHGLMLRGLRRDLIKTSGTWDV